MDQVILFVAEILLLGVEILAGVFIAALVYLLVSTMLSGMGSGK